LIRHDSTAIDLVEICVCDGDVVDDDDDDSSLALVVARIRPEMKQRQHWQSADRSSQMIDSLEKSRT
jgi:hypothetical protein